MAEIRAITAGPDPKLIKSIEGLLERCKTGEVQAVAYCGVTKEGGPFNGWEGNSHADTVAISIRLLDREFMEEFY